VLPPACVCVCVSRARAHALLMVLGGNPTVGTPFPDVAVDIGFFGLDPKNRVQTGALNAGKKNLWVSLPGAFTPT